MVAAIPKALESVIGRVNDVIESTPQWMLYNWPSLSAYQAAGSPAEPFAVYQARAQSASELGAAQTPPIVQPPTVGGGGSAVSQSTGYGSVPEPLAPRVNVPSIIPNYLQGVDTALSPEGAVAGYGYNQGPAYPQEKPGLLDKALGAVGDVAGAAANVPLGSVVKSAPLIGEPLSAALGLGGAATGNPITVGDTAQWSMDEQGNPVSRFMANEVRPAVGSAAETLVRAPYQGAARLLEAAGAQNTAAGVRSGGETAGNVAEFTAEMLTPASPLDLALSVVVPSTADWEPFFRAAKNAGLIDDVGRVLASERGGVRLVDLLGQYGKRIEDLPELPQGAAEALVRGTPVDQGTDAARVLTGPGAGRELPAGATYNPGIRGAADNIDEVTDLSAARSSRAAAAGEATAGTPPSAVSSPASSAPAALPRGAMPGASLEDQFAASMRLGREGMDAAKAAQNPRVTVADMRKALDDAGKSSTGTASEVANRYRQMQSEAIGGIGTPQENVGNAARNAYETALERSGDPEAARLAARKAAAQEQGANSRAARMADAFANLKRGLSDEAGMFRVGGNVEPPKAPAQGVLDGFGLPNESRLSRVGKNLATLPAVAKYLQTSGDVFGFQVRQGLPTAFIDPKAWGRNFGRIRQGYFEDPLANDAMKAVQQLRRFSDGQVLDTIDPSTGKNIVIKPMSEIMGVHLEVPGMEKINDSLVMRFAENFPLAKRSEKGLRVGYLGAATDLRNGMIDDAIRAGINDQAWFDHYDDIAKAWVGYGDVPELLKGLNGRFYSMRNIAARFQTATQPFTKPGPVFRSPGKMVADRALFSASPRGVATRNLVRFAAGELSLMYMLGMAGEQSGLFEVGWNPLESGFGRVEFPDPNGNTISIDLLGGYSSMIKMIAKTAEAVATGEDPVNAAFAEQVKFWRYKSAPGASLIIDNVIENTNLRDVDELDSPFARNIFDMDTWTSGQLAEYFTPFFAGDAVQALLRGALDINEPGDLAEAAGLLLAGWGISNVSLFEQSPYGELSRARLTAIMELQAEGVLPADLYPEGTEWSDLGPGARDLVDARVRGEEPSLITNAEAARRDQRDVFQQAKDQARLNFAGDRARLDPQTGEVKNGVYQRVFERSMAGIEEGAHDKDEAKLIMDNARSTYDKARAAEAAAYRTPEYLAAIEGLPDSDIHSMFNEWYEVIYQSFDERTGLTDWDLVDRKQAELLEQWRADDPEAAARFEFERDNREKNLPEIIQLDRDLKDIQDAAGFYEMSDDEKDQWFIDNPQEAALSWLLGGRNLPSIAAMQEALNIQELGLGTGREDIKLSGFDYTVNNADELETFAMLYDVVETEYLSLESGKRSSFLDKNPDITALLIYLGYDITMTEKRIEAGAERELQQLIATYGQWNQPELAGVR